MSRDDNYFLPTSDADYSLRRIADALERIADKMEAPVKAEDRDDQPCRACGHDGYEHPQACSASDCGCMGFRP